jgi:hypothetical protein
MEPAYSILLLELSLQQLQLIGVPWNVSDLIVSWSSLRTWSGNGTYPRFGANFCPSVMAHEMKSVIAFAFV